MNVIGYDVSLITLLIASSNDTLGIICPFFNGNFYICSCLQLLFITCRSIAPCAELSIDTYSLHCTCLY